VVNFCKRNYDGTCDGTRDDGARVPSRRNFPPSDHRPETLVLMLNSERRERSVNAVLGASLETLQTVGYNRLRTADVAKRSGMSEGTLFRHFPSKLDLVRASLQLALDNHVKRLSETLIERTPTGDRRDVLEAIWGLLAHEELLWTYELFAAASTDAELQAAIQPILETHTEIVDGGSVLVMRDVFGIPEADGRMAINLVAWSMQGLVLREMGRGDTGAKKDLLDYLTFVANSMYPQG
jgi:AcrR family transcriptional regulator